MQFSGCSGTLKRMENLEGTNARRVNLRPRLLAAAELIGNAHTVADIGCDHGRLGVALLQRGIARHVVAADISAASLEKARWLCERTGQTAHMELRVGDGLAPVAEGEVDVVVICGMGGRQIADILQQAAPLLKGAERAVFQPMRGAAELRQYLHQNGYRITRERIILDARRDYQLLAVEAGQAAVPPEGWPEGFFELGFLAMCETRFQTLAKAMLKQYEKSMAEAAGTPGEDLLKWQVSCLRRVLALHAVRL